MGAGGVALTTRLVAGEELCAKAHSASEQTSITSTPILIIRELGKIRAKGPAGELGFWPQDY